MRLLSLLFRLFPFVSVDDILNSLWLMSKDIGLLVLISSGFFGVCSQKIVYYLIEAWVFSSCDHLLSANDASIFLFLDEMGQARSAESVVAWLNAHREDHYIATQGTRDVFFD